MKNFSLVLNLVLLVAVGILYYLHFSTKQDTVEVISAAPLKESSIVFVNSDSMLNQYSYFKNKKSEFKKKQESIEGSLKAESMRLQNEVMDYQKNSISMSGQQRQQIEEQLTMKQQEFLKKKDDLISQLDDEQSRTNEELYNKLTAYVREFNKKKNYSFILGYQRGGGILFANDSLDITREVVTGLNTEFEKEQHEKK